MFISGGGSIKTITVRLDEELHKKFKIYSIKNERDMQGILVEYIEKLVNEEKKEN